MSQRIIPAATLLLALLTGGCGAAGTTPSDAPSSGGARPSALASLAPSVPASAGASLPTTARQLTVDPCTLVTAAEASTYAGSKVTLSHNPVVPGVCQYRGENGSTFTVQLPSASVCSLMVESLRSNHYVSSVQKRVSIGAGGILLSGFGKVDFVAGGGCVSVQARTPSGGPASDDAVTELARTAVSHVP